MILREYQSILLMESQKFGTPKVNIAFGTVVVALLSLIGWHWHLFIKCQELLETYISYKTHRNVNFNAFDCDNTKENSYNCIPGNGWDHGLPYFYCTFGQTLTLMNHMWSYDLTSNRIGSKVLESHYWKITANLWQTTRRGQKFWTDSFRQQRGVSVCWQMWIDNTGQ